MTALLTDPVVLICTAVILVGVFGFFWALGKFRRTDPGEFEPSPTDDLIVAPAPTVPDIEIRAPALGWRAPAAPVVAPGVNKDVADRLESMTQRLSEMQTVLLKQSAASSASGSAGGSAGVGQGFSPETIDKLLKIIGNVIQQVDILQKNLNISK